MGQLILPSFSTIYVDTSVLIYSLEGNLDYISLLQPLWLKFQAGEIEIVSSYPLYNSAVETATTQTKSACAD